MKTLLNYCSAVLLVLLVFSSGFGQDSSSTFSYAKKREKFIQLVQYKFAIGEYDELISLVQKSQKQWGKKQQAQPSEFIQLLLLEARANFLQMKFDEATRLEKVAIQKQVEAKTSVSTKDAWLGNYHLSSYYCEIGNYLAAEKYCNSADSLLKNSGTELQKIESALIRACVLLHQEYYDEAMALVEKQFDYRLRMASAESVESRDRLRLNSKIDYSERKERYASLVNLKAEILVHKEQFAEAEQLLENHKNWINKNIGKNSTAYRDLLVIQAFKAMNNNSPARSAILYQNAYTSFTCKEDEGNKVTNLSESIIGYLKTGDAVRSQNYLRRLQMFAFQYVGKSERFHIAYEYTQAVKLMLEGQLAAANERLEIFFGALNGMPEYHAQYMKAKELQLLIARKANDIVLLNKTELELAAIKGNYYGKNTPAYHKALLYIAIEEIRYGSKFKEAESIFRSSYDGFLRTKILPVSKDNSYYLTAYAELFLKTDRFDSATAKAAQVIKINRSAYGPASAEYGLALANFSEYSILAGKYQQGLDSLKKVTAINDFKSGDVVKRQKIYLVMARLNKLFGEYDESKKLSANASKLNRESKFDEDVLVKVESDEQLSDLYIQMENYSKAERALQKSLVDVSSFFGSKSPKLIPVYFGLTRLNLITGNIHQSDVFLEKSKSIIDSIFGAASIPMSEYYLLAGDYFSSINDFKKAEESFMKADNIQSKKLGKKHLKRAEILLSLASLYSAQTTVKSAEVEKLYKEALEIVKSSIGSSTPLYAEIEEEYAEFLIQARSYDSADKLLEEAEKFWISKLGKENRHVAYINLLRGNILYSKSKYDDAEKKYTKAKDAYASIYSTKHIGYNKSLGKLARVYYMKKQPEKSMVAMNEIITNYLDYVQHNFPSLSFRQKSHYWRDLKEEFEFYTFVALQQPVNGINLKYTGNVYNNILATKALLLSSNIKLLEKIQMSNDSTLIALYTQLITEKENLVSVLALTKQQQSEQGIDLAKLEEHTEELEKQLAHRSELFATSTPKQITWKDVQSKLQPKEYAIEVTSFRAFNKVFTDSVVYAALIINMSTQENPDLVIMPNGKKMQTRHLKYYRNTSMLNTKDENSYDVFWQPIKNKIEDGSLVYFSGDGVYNQLNLEMLPKKGSNTYVLDENQLVLVTNTKDLLNMEEVGGTITKKSKKESKNKKVASPDEYILCGSPVFYTNAKVLKKNVPDLPGAEREIQELNSLLVSAEKKPTMLMNTFITEDTMKAVHSPKVLHIATHGYFKESVVSGVNEDDIASHPLLNSGLMLLGSGDIVDNPDNKYVNQKDGILTAYEALNMSLDNTDIVILSACETGRGEVQLGEGVYGLQRAFLLAGAKAVVISLFKVNDEVTQKLMVTFYKSWLKSGDKRQAFVDAKKAIKREYDNPIYWGAFIMIEGKPERVAAAKQ